jgi:hypothetical protein
MTDDIRYLHCANCIMSGNEKYHGDMEAYLDTKIGELFLICKVCKKDVFKTILAPEIAAKFKGCKCAECEKEKKF